VKVSRKGFGGRAFMEQGSKAGPAAQNEIRREEVKSLGVNSWEVVMTNSYRNLEAPSTREKCEGLACCQEVHSVLNCELE
jgi:hypothetical protein